MKTDSEKNLSVYFENSIDNSTRKFLKKILKDVSQRNKFEIYLNKNYSLSMWMFWVDLNNVIENKMQSHAIFALVNLICKKYFAEDTTYEVKN